MAQFVIRLEKEEIDELMNSFRLNDNEHLAIETLDHNQLKSLAQNLIVQNGSLIKLFKKIEPATP